MNGQNLQNISSNAGYQQAAQGVQQPVNANPEEIKQMAVKDLNTIKNLLQPSA